jgi:hypothetical protein
LWPYYGGVGNGSTQGNFVSVRQSLDGWISWNGCDPAPVQGTLPDPVNDGTNSSTFVWFKCAGGVQVEHIRVDGGGHTWPDGWQYLGQATIGRTSRDFSANEKIWEFFKRWRIEPNRAPETPMVDGPAVGLVNSSLTFNASSTDPDGNWIKYEMEWGDGLNSSSAFVASGTKVGLPHFWTKSGIYWIRARATDSEGASSSWSAPITLEVRASSGEPVDRTPPVITHTPVAKAIRGDEIRFEAKVRDDRALAKVELFYMLGADPWNSMEMLPAGVDLFSATIPGASTNGTGMLYYVQAKDATGNKACDPAACDAYPHQIELIEPGPDPQVGRNLAGIVGLFLLAAILAAVLVVVGLIVMRKRRRQPTARRST